MKSFTALLIAVSFASFVVMGYADEEPATEKKPDELAAAGGEGAAAAASTPAPDTIVGTIVGSTKEAPGAETSSSAGPSSVSPSTAPSVESTTNSAPSLLAPLTSMLFVVFAMAR